MVMYIVGLYLAALLLVNLAGIIGRRTAGLRNPFRRSAVSFNSLFSGSYVDSRAFYMYRFNEVPCITFVGELDVTGASGYIRASLAEDIVSVYQHNHFNYAANELQFNVTLFILRDGRMIELGINYAEILHTNMQYQFAGDLATALAAFRMAPESDAVAQNLTPIQVAGFMRQHEMN